MLVTSSGADFGVTSLYCGFDNAIEIFDVGRPGDEGYRMKTTRTRSSRDGQKGERLSLIHI